MSIVEEILLAPCYLIDNHKWYVHYSGIILFILWYIPAFVILAIVGAILMCPMLVYSAMAEIYGEYKENKKQHSIWRNRFIEKVKQNIEVTHEPPTEDQK